MTSISLERRLTDWRHAVPLAVFGVSVAALAAAYIGEYVFDLQPCILCLYQRVPYAVTGLLALLALAVRARTSWPPALIRACAIVFVAGASLAFYHVGVEEHWWASIAACGNGSEPWSALSIEDLRAGLDAPTLKPCDQVDWRLFGLSLAGYNTVVSLALAAGCAVGARFMEQGKHH